MIINSDTSGLSDLLARLNEAKNALPDLLVQSAQCAGNAVQDKLSDAAPKGASGGNPPPGDAPGTLSESFYTTAEMQANGASAVAEVNTRQPLKLQYVTEGTGVYIGKGRIVPTVKKALMWNGAPYPMKSVAGQRANDFVSPVLADDDSMVEPELQSVFDGLSEILEG